MVRLLERPLQEPTMGAILTPRAATTPIRLATKHTRPRQSSLRLTDCVVSLTELPRRSSADAAIVATEFRQNLTL